MNVETVGRLRYESGIEAWAGRIYLPRLQQCAVRWEVSTTSLERTKQKKWLRKQDALVVEIQSPDRAPPTVEQEASLRYLREHEGQSATACLRYALRECKATKYDVLPNIKSLTKDQAATRKRLDTLVGFCELVQPTGLVVLRQATNGFSYITVDFETSLDEEHGICVTLLKSTPIAFAGAGEGREVYQAADDAVSRWLSAEAEYLSVLKQVTDVATARQAADTLLRLVNTLSEAAHESRMALTSGTTMKKFTEAKYAQYDEYQRLWSKCPDAAAVLDAVLGKKSREWRSHRPKGRKR